MIQEISSVTDFREVADGIYVLRFVSPYIARASLPGQFVNVRPASGTTPLLRRPFSICRAEGEEVEIVFNVIGVGTRILAAKRPGDTVDVLGPLGNPFGFENGFETAVMVAGGLGVAPFPFLTQKLTPEKKVKSFVGAGTGAKVWSQYLNDVYVATDDGSVGFHGTVVAQLEDFLMRNKPQNPRIFGCGPTKMLKALSEVATRFEIDCELSLEGDMACGVGICQGCPVERVNAKKKYSLVCTEGPTFNCNEIILQ